MKRIYCVLTIAVICALPTATFAWGREGHDIISQIAFRLLSDSTKQKVSKLLGGLSFEEVGMWMDDIRSNTAFDYMKPWHYTNIEKGATYDPKSDNNIIWELQRTIKQLKENVGGDSAKTDLYILFHLIGDLHQPLHVGYGSDRGGNTINILFLNESTNLHRLWDWQIIRNQNITVDDYFNLYKPLSQEEITRIKKIDVINWMNESRVLLDNVYTFSGNTIDDAYARNSKMIIEKQLLYAGIRLASILGNIF